MSTLVYLLVLGIAVGTVALIVWSILDQAWLGLIIGVLLLALQLVAIWEGRFAPKDRIAVDYRGGRMSFEKKPARAAA